MEDTRHLILINGQDKTESVASYRFQDGICEVVFTGSPKPYHYRGGKVQVLAVQRRIDPAGQIIVVNGAAIPQVEEILDFGPFYRLRLNGRKSLTYPKAQVELQKNCLADVEQKEIFDYFKETAATVSLVSENGQNILQMQYERCKDVLDTTVLSCYLDLQKLPGQYHPGPAGHRQDSDHFEYHCQRGPRGPDGGGGLKQ